MSYVSNKEYFDENKFYNNNDTYTSKIILTFN